MIYLGIMKRKVHNRCIYRSGVSPVVAAVLMTAIIVVLGTVVVLWGISAFGLFGQGIETYYKIRSEQLMENIIIEYVQFIEYGNLTIYVRNVGTIEAEIEALYIVNLKNSSQTAVITLNPSILVPVGQLVNFTVTVPWEWDLNAPYQIKLSTSRATTESAISISSYIVKVTIINTTILKTVGEPVITYGQVVDGTYVDTHEKDGSYQSISESGDGGSEILTYYETIVQSEWNDIPNIDADDGQYAWTDEDKKLFWVSMDNTTLTGTIKSVVIKIDCWVQKTRAGKEFKLYISTDGTTTTTGKPYYEFDATTSETTYEWNITSYINSWDDLNNLYIGVESRGGPRVRKWFVEYLRVEVVAEAVYIMDFYYKFSTTINPNNITNITVITYGYTSGETIHLAIYNFTSGTWYYIGDITETSPSWTNITLTSGLSDFINDEGKIYIRFYTDADSVQSDTVYIDYLIIKVVYVGG